MAARLTTTTAATTMPPSPLARDQARDRQRLTAAERQRAYRARLREGRRIVPVEIDQAIIEDALVRRGFLRGEDADNPEKVTAALRAAVRQLIVPPAEPDDAVMRNAIDFLTVR
jgi:hypothetical protein